MTLPEMDEEMVGTIIAVAIFVSLIAAIGVWSSQGWPGAFADPTRPNAGQLGTDILSWGFAVTGLSIGARKFTATSPAGKTYGILFATAVLICCSKDWRYLNDEQLNFSEWMDVSHLARFVAPTVAAYLIAAGARIFLRRST